MQYATTLRRHSLRHATAAGALQLLGHALRRRVYLMAKRFFDVTLSLLLLALLLPIMLGISLLIRLVSPGPAIYCQRRLTDGGKVFTLFKFRTMVADAEAGTGAVWARRRDPRLIPCGRFLRRSRLDELPQLLNVLIGDMSLVGPRPERPELATRLTERFPSFAKRTAVKAGLTGLAQVSAGYAACEESYREKLALDLLYIKQQSLALDLKILLQTFEVVVRGRGAR